MNSRQSTKATNEMISANEARRAKNAGIISTAEMHNKSKDEVGILRETFKMGHGRSGPLAVMVG